MGLQLMNGFISRINPISGFCRHLLSARFKLPLHIDEKGVKQSVDKLNLPVKPKKPLSPFFKFMLQIRPKLKEENPNCSIGEISKKISSRWEKIDPVERSNFEVQYQQEKEEYEKAKLTYENSLTNDQKAALQEEKMRILEERAKKKLRNKAKDFERPKKPPSSYILYSLSRINARGDTSLTEWQKMLSKEWSIMHESQKEKYVNEAKRLKLNYLDNLKKWEEKMISLGHVDLVRTEVLVPKTKLRK
ncbi:transcription factor A, mitochondrial-like [Lycorma delicatula]|uniref:transcription factor A, mitochondrial-like n=1 Tax=Lycorma delicatula TaxID=130591 RepID=UPI003F50EF21